MRIQHIEFIVSADQKHQFPKDYLPQIVIVGRSNVGKSSFINAMLNHQTIAKVSQTPGKTRLINFFLINKSFYFVDLPGYGYARVSKDQLEVFRRRIETFFTGSNSLSLGILLLDSRRTPSEDDFIMQQFFRELGLPVMYILTKVDKLSNNERFVQMRTIRSALHLSEQDSVMFFSSKTKYQREAIWDMIMPYVTQESEKP
jgi:GTP-binding protein